MLLFQSHDLFVGWDFITHMEKCPEFVPELQPIWLSTTTFFERLIYNMNLKLQDSINFLTVSTIRGSTTISRHIPIYIYLHFDSLLQQWICSENGSQSRATCRSHQEMITICSKKNNEDEFASDSVFNDSLVFTKWIRYIQPSFIIRKQNKVANEAQKMDVSWILYKCTDFQNFTKALR